MKHILDHIENFIDDESAELRERAKNFVVQSGLDQVESLVAGDPQDKDIAPRVLDRLSPFFEGGLLLQNGKVTDLFWRGNVFHLGVKDQIAAQNILPEITPLQVHKTTAKKILSHLKLDFMVPKGDAEGYLLKPTPVVGFVLISTLAAPWTEDHVAHAHRLINKCFLY